MKEKSIYPKKPSAPKYLGPWQKNIFSMLWDDTNEGTSDPKIVPKVEVILKSGIKISGKKYTIYPDGKLDIYQGNKAWAVDLNEVAAILF